MLKATILAAVVLSSGSAYAEDVIIQRDAPDVVAAPPARSTTTVERHDRDCDSKSVRTENADGDSKTVTRTDCD